MKQRPMLYSAPMVQALLNGTKTQTRRVAKLTDAGHVKEPGGHRRWHTADANATLACPYGQPGDQLWVREAFAFTDAHEPEFLGSIEYRADNKCMAVDNGPELVDAPHGCDPRPFDGPWKPSIHMPRWASRITLEITGVRVERLQAISEADAIAEGCTENHNGYFWGGPHAISGLKQMATAVSAYRDLWESINGTDSWAANPLVWVIEFRRVKP